jgi:hypothetical protein
VRSCIVTGQGTADSLDDDVVATKPVIDLQDGPAILVANRYGGSVIT